MYLLTIVGLVAAACTGTSGAVVTTTTAAATTTISPPTSTTPPTTSSTSPTSTTTTLPAVPTTETRLVPTGPEEMVFDWTTDRCEDLNIPDISSRAIRNADGLVQLYIGHYVTYRMVGPDLEHLEMDCSQPVFTSSFDSDPARFDEASWIAAPYTDDGRTVYAVIHNEYRGSVFQPDGLCPKGDYLSCIDVTLTMAKSTDGGATYSFIAEPPDHLIASLPYTYDPEGVASGLWQTSNLLRRDDGYFYLMTNIAAYPTNTGLPPRQWSCLLRSNDLADTASWRYWDGTGFDGRFIDPYREEADPTAVCPPVARDVIGAELMEAVVYDDSIGQYVAMGMAPAGPVDGVWGLAYSHSDDLIHWSARQFVLELPANVTVADDLNDTFYAYPAIIDPDSPSPNFDTSDGEFYVYVTRFNSGGDSLDRDLLRIPVRFETVTLEAPRWDFDTDGDSEGWVATNQLEPFTVADGLLKTMATGDDPFMEGPATRFPGPEYPTMRITMRLDADGAETFGQIFFLTEDDTLWSEEKSTTFPINGDGEFHTYDIDFSSVRSWAALVTQFRIDPGDVAGSTIEIDSIEFP